MSYTDMDIEMKALSMLGSNVPDEDAVMLRTVRAAAAAELKAEGSEDLYVVTCFSDRDKLLAHAEKEG